MLRREEMDEAVLGVVDVLVLVDEDVAEALLPLGRDLGMGLEHLDRLLDEVVEVEGAVVGEGGLVAAIDGGDDLLEGALRRAAIVIRAHHLILRAADGVEDVGGLVLLRVVVGVDQGLAGDGLLVALVEDHEVVGHADGLAIDAEDAGADRMESAGPDARRHLADEVGDARLHLVGGLVGEGDREDVLGRDAGLADHVGDAVGERAGLATAGAGEDENGAFGRRGGHALLRVKPFQDCAHEGIRLLPSPNGVGPNPGEEGFEMQK